MCYMDICEHILERSDEALHEYRRKQGRKRVKNYLSIISRSEKGKLKSLRRKQIKLFLGELTRRETLKLYKCEIKMKTSGKGISHQTI